MKIRATQLSVGVYLVELLDQDFQIVCGCPPDTIKLLAKRGYIREIGANWEKGPDAVLLSDLPIQNGLACNLTEFLILHMLYKQGKLIPGHPGNDGSKPLLIGSQAELEAQLNYLYRGNYGLVSEDELLATGLSQEEAAWAYEVKKYFGFGQISRPDHLIDTQVLEVSPVKLANGLRIARSDINVFEFHYKNQAVTIDLNLKPTERYEPAVFLSKTQVTPRYFSIIHSGDGDGWDPNRPCMGSIICYDGDYYLIDACPNIHNSLLALGISINDIKGVFITHCHDDHFAGIFNLFQSSSRIHFYTTPWVRKTVSLKACALLGIDYDQLGYVFNIRDLEANVWNNIDGLEVYPSFSPHPVETAYFTFRILWEGGYRSYAHLADICSFAVMDKMLESGVMNASQAEQMKAAYLKPATVKKIDSGGGLIHGDAQDFSHDRSEKILLSHKSSDLSIRERQIGSSAPFGSVDVLIEGKQLYEREIQRAFKSYFPAMNQRYFKKFLHCESITLNAETIITKDSPNVDYVYLTLKGVVERLDEDLRHQEILSGTIIGDLGLVGLEKSFTYRSKSFAKLLKIPSEIYMETIRNFELGEYLHTIYSKLLAISDTKIFEHLAPTVHFKSIIASLEEVTIFKGEDLHEAMRKFGSQSHLFVIKQGCIRCGDGLRTDGEFCLEEQVIEGLDGGDAVAVEDTVGFIIQSSLVKSIPFLYWKVFETRGRLHTQRYRLAV